MFSIEWTGYNRFNPLERRKTRTVPTHDTETHLSRLVEQAAKGQGFVIAKAGRPMVRVVPIKPMPAVHLLGFQAGKGAFKVDAKMASKRISTPCLCMPGDGPARLLLDNLLLLWSAFEPDSLPPTRLGLLSRSHHCRPIYAITCAAATSGGTVSWARLST